MRKKYNVEINSSIIDLTAIGQIDRDTMTKVINNLTEKNEYTFESFYNMIVEASREECTEKSSMLLDCNYTVTDDYFEISYDLAEEEDDVRHILRFDRTDGTVTRVSDGPVSSTMQFDRSCPFTISEFSLMGMKLNLEVMTRLNDWKLDEDGGSASLEYVLSQNGQYMQLCNIEIKLTSYMQRELFEDESD